MFCLFQNPASQMSDQQSSSGQPVDGAVSPERPAENIEEQETNFAFRINEALAAVEEGAEEIDLSSCDLTELPPQLLNCPQIRVFTSLNIEHTCLYRPTPSVM